MAWLKFYETEHNRYKEYYEQKYSTPKNADKIVKKLLRHFGLKYIGTRYDMKEGYGQAGLYVIRLPRKNISLGVICHEIGHHVARKKTGQWYHNHKTKMKMKQVYRYAKKYLRNLDIDNWTYGNDVY